MATKGYFTLLFDPSSGIEEIVWNKQNQDLILGRKTKKETKIENIIQIGDYNGISRKHAKISWNSCKGCWDLKVLGKFVWSNGKCYNRNDIISLSMTEPTPLKFTKHGYSKFYFLPPIIPK